MPDEQLSAVVSSDVGLSPWATGKSDWSERLAAQAMEIAYRLSFLTMNIGTTEPPVVELPSFEVGMTLQSAIERSFSTMFMPRLPATVAAPAVVRMWDGRPAQQFVLHRVVFRFPLRR